MAADSFQQSLDRAIAEVRTWPKWKRTLLGAATPEDAKEKEMAAGQERNRKIMQAFELAPFKRYVDDAGPGFYTYEWLSEATKTGSGIFDWQRCADDDLPKFPDFSLPEWQIKIQERVQELSRSGAVHYHYIPGTGHIVSTEAYDSWMTVSTEDFKETMREAYEDCLLQLAEREVKHD